jgi:hypothetical protein
MRLSFLIILTAFYGHLSAQFSIRGTVKDATSLQPIIGAPVYLPDLKKGTITDEEGKFILENLPKGKFLLEI